MGAEDSRTGPQEERVACSSTILPLEPAVVGRFRRSHPSAEADGPEASGSFRAAALLQHPERPHVPQEVPPGRPSSSIRPSSTAVQHAKPVRAHIATLPTGGSPPNDLAVES